jgi:DNA polymerase-3 subunit gamma/tau
MSYTVLARKWRPRRFAELIGQQHVVTALVNSLGAQRLHHAYLFAGTRGVGKTTVARILAKALNCAQGIVAEPCGECEACVAIDEGRFVDLIEVDAASRTRVDDTRELLENVQYTPTQGRFKVYLIDEVHMLSNHSFNALLKTLEEPPPHIKFLLATTDPQKLPVTVLSRCIQFNLKRLTMTQIGGQLEKICAEEAITVDPEGLRALAKAAEGSMRDALSLLDQAIAFGGGGVSSEQVNAMLGTIDRGHVVRLIQGLAAGDGSALLNEVADLDEHAPDYGTLLDDLMGQLQRIAVIQLVGPLDEDDDDDRFQALATTISPEDVQLYYQIALHARRDLPACRDPRSAFEMTLLRMLAFRPAAEPTAAKAAAAKTGPAGGSAAARPGARAPRQLEPQGLRRSGEVARAAAEAGKPPGRAASADAASQGRSAGQGVEDWEALLKSLDVRGAPRQLAEHCSLGQVSAGRIGLVVAAENAHLNTDRVRGRLQEVLSEHLGRRISLTVTTGKPRAPTPAQSRAASENQRMRRAREAIESDPNVKAAQAAFDAILEADTIQPQDTGKKRERV